MIRDYKNQIKPLGSTNKVRFPQWSRLAVLCSATVITVLILTLLPENSEPVQAAIAETDVADTMVISELTLDFADDSQQQPAPAVLADVATSAASPELIPAQSAQQTSKPSTDQPQQLAAVTKANAITPGSQSDNTIPAAATPLTETDAAEQDIATETTAPSTLNWQTVTVKSGDSMALIFARAKLSASELHELIQAGPETKKLRNIHPGQQISIATTPDGKLQQLTYKINEITTLEIKRQQNTFQSRLNSRQYETRVTHAAGTIHHSLFLAGMEAGLTDSMTMDLAGIFGWDIDFALDIRSGDRFVVVYEEKYLDGVKVRDGNILAAEFTNNNKTYRSIRYTDANGNTGFYDADGRSMRKAFLRTPVDFSRISSRFSSGRKHPVLNRIRAHKGVDYAASRGTPIRATGDGKIVYRGRKGGYGKAVVIRHGSRYTTLYAHLNNYNRKARLGSRVKQGQIIGYVGSSGLATGPHLHYEFRLNGVHRNPLTVRLPKSASLGKKFISDFKQQAEPLLSQLDTLSRTQVAMSGQNSN